MKHESWIAAVGVSGFIIDRILKYYVLSFPAGKIFSFGAVEFGHFLNPALFFFPAWRFIPWLALAVLIGLVSWCGVGFAARIGVVQRLRGNRIPKPLDDTSSHTANVTLLPIILGGASNVFDRFAYGGVIDYVNILGIATINLADILIMVGIVLLLIRHFEERSDEKSHTLP